MFAIVEKRYDLLILQYKTRHISSIRTDELVDLVLNTFHYADVTSGMAFLSSEKRSLKLCTSAERV
jgi:hypothetical protein